VWCGGRRSVLQLQVAVVACHSYVQLCNCQAAVPRDRATPLRGVTASFKQRGAVAVVGRQQCRASCWCPNWQRTPAALSGTKCEIGSSSELAAVQNCVGPWWDFKVLRQELWCSTC
jgi:hypothetical protein